MDTVSSREGPRPVTRVARDLLAGLLPLLGLALWVQGGLDLPGLFTAQVLALYLVASILILRAVPATLPGPGAGAANRVTLARGLLVLTVAGLALQAGVEETALREAAVFLAGIALLLDGVDGWIARRTGTGTAFGARFDMETDAFLILALSVLAWRGGPVGPWILGIGSLRYLFVLAGRIWPRLRRELPPSYRRKVVCVVQGVALLVVLAPLFPAALAWAVGALAFASLVASFTVDTVWALRTPLPTSPPSTTGPRPAPDPAMYPVSPLGGRPGARSYRVRTRSNASWATDATTSPPRLK